MKKLMKPVLVREAGLRQILGGAETAGTASPATDSSKVIQVSSSNMDAVISLIR